MKFDANKIVQFFETLDNLHSGVMNFSNARSDVLSHFDGESIVFTHDLQSVTITMAKLHDVDATKLYDELLQCFKSDPAVTIVENK